MADILEINLYFDYECEKNALHFWPTEDIKEKIKEIRKNGQVFQFSFQKVETSFGWKQWSTTMLMFNIKRSISKIKIERVKATF